MIKTYLIVILIILGIQPDACAQKNNEMFTIYLVRHSEKDGTSANQSDPPLTPCGEQRSESLSNFFKDIDIDVIYSTDFNRTKSTALPTAALKELKIEEYDDGNLKDFAKSLIENKQNALVVGHSNTTGVLAGLLGGKEIGEFDLSIYNRIYQVVISKNSSQINLFHTAFNCDD